MRKPQINLEHKSLITSVIKENSMYAGNEELLNFFVEAVYKKSYIIIDSIHDKKRLRRHLAAICNNCLEQIIKEKQRYDSIKVKIPVEFAQDSDIVGVKSTPFSEPTDNYQTKINDNIVNLKEEIQIIEKYGATDALIDPLDLCPQKRVSEHTVNKLVKIVKSIEELYPNKRYFEIFKYRYIKRYNQTSTASEMKISQVELSKRFVEMIKLVKEQL